jgi:hypothetical protein
MRDWSCQGESVGAPRALRFYLSGEMRNQGMYVLDGRPFVLAEDMIAIPRRR